MTQKKFLIGLLIISLAIGLTLVAATLVYPRMALAQGNTGGKAGPFNDWRGSNLSSYESRLAQALGISVADLQNAQEEARVNAIQQAVDQGLITQAQADQMILRGGFAFGGRGGNFGRDSDRLNGPQGSAINYQALLAKALGLSEADLQAAAEKAQAAGVQEALDAGLITQAQADQMLARIHLQPYLNREALLAQALGMSVDDLRTALSQGKSLTTLLQEQNTDAVTVRKALVAAYQAAIQQAVTAGAITQAQADQFLSRGFNFFGPNELQGGRLNGPRGFEGRNFGGPGGRFQPGGPGGQGRPRGMPGNRAPGFFPNNTSPVPPLAPGYTI